MRASSAIPKKCSVVQVEGCDGATEEEVLQSSPVHIEHLKAIDLELAKYDGEVDTDLQPRVEVATVGLLNDPEGLLGVEDGEHVTEIASTH
nr:hypothetical protein CFP56_23249 [Quercus suber]